MVTGRFENAKLHHMMAAAVREANASGLQWLPSGQSQDVITEPVVTPSGV
ncbi:hypothetical protein BH18VER2_BH18VER2_11420 [soil metagenome]